MAATNRERVNKAMDLLQAGLKPFVERELQNALGQDWVSKAGLLETKAAAGAGRTGKPGQIAPHWDTAALLGAMWDQWNAVFRQRLGQAERSLVSELRDARNRWAHQHAFTVDDAYRALDSAQRLLAAVSAPEAAEIERIKRELLRTQFEEQQRQETRKAAQLALGGQPAAGLRPWRDIVTPHPDVASGRYQQAEFAADLAQVYRGEASGEYGNPTEFFRRTYLTSGLKQLLAGALRRLTATGGDPVVELQTNFGGGKTHSMLALYHLFSGIPAADLPGLEPLLAEAGIKQPPQARRAVLVGTALSPGQPHKHKDGTVVRTLWGELAYQLLGKAGYQLVADSDRAGTSPGSNLLTELLKKAAPCLVLIDEWVAFARQLYVHGGANGRADLPAGSFEANISFAQALTEAAKAVPRALLVIAVPASDVEAGGEAGHAALQRLAAVLARIETSWQPASAEEGFEIVRRRLFQPITDADGFAARDAVARAFAEMYWGQQQEFPAECRQPEYEKRIKAAYPIHPEFFDRLYEDWSTLDKFQRTRGVLRLMAAIIHSLWERNDPGLLILPASAPLDEPRVQAQLMHFLGEDPWVPVIATDVDGPHSLPLALDRENPNLGRYSASRRAARAVFLGSAPTLRAAHRGIEDRGVKLGCAQPGETVATFGDALRRLAERASYLYSEDRRYWYSPQPSVARLAQDREGQKSREEVLTELERRLHGEEKRRGSFHRVHACPASGADVADEPEARLVILPPSVAHLGKDAASGARKLAAAILDQRGAGQRNFRNALVFLAADGARMPDLETKARRYLAWNSIVNEADRLNLDPAQARLAQERLSQATQDLEAQIAATYVWILTPHQAKGDAEEWLEFRAQGGEVLADRVAKKLSGEGQLYPALSATELRLELDRVPLWRGSHVGLQQLAEDFARYTYLPRLREPAEEIAQAVSNGLALTTWEKDGVAYADAWDESEGRYRGLRSGELLRLNGDSRGLVVKPEAALAQRANEAAKAAAAAGAGAPAGVAPGGPVPAAGPVAAGASTSSSPGGDAPAASAAKVAKRFHAAVQLDPQRLARDAGKIADEIVQHLGKLPGATVQVTLEIDADMPGGAPEDTVRTVNENCRTLRVASSGFEEN